MVFNTLRKMVLGDPIERTLKKYRPIVEAVNAQEPHLQSLTDQQLRTKTDEFKQRLAKGETLEDLLVEAFALVREASRRTIGLRHHDVQIIGGVVLHEGKIAEMRTGEGKTLVATLPVYLNALAGQGVHIITPNDYLSKVGLQTMGQIYHFLGLNAGVIQNMGANPNLASFVYDPTYESEDDRYQNLRPCSRQEAYATDITYGTNNELGFDYLRDNMVLDRSQMAQRGLNFAIVDEVDNILIDEARTPLIISGPAEKPSDYYRTFTQIVNRLKPSSQESIDNENPDGDYVIDLKDRIAFLTEAGVERIEKILNVDALYSPENSEMIPYLDNCLRAWALFHRDKEYVVQDEQVVIVDEFTGRMMVGRRFSEGLHQAIEAKEGVEIRRENVTMATVTFQNFFRMYRKLAGMTGTAATEAEEFEKIYNLDVVTIPTHKPIVRLDQPDFVYATEEAKFRAVVKDIQERQQKGQPVLVGTASIDTSQRLSSFLKKARIEHEVLNAKQHEREAIIIAQAGRKGAVTIATNMAGRGVDILLGGNPEGLARETLRRRGVDVTTLSREEWQAALANALTVTSKEREEILALGGLYVLGTERHDARRIDNQLRGRAGRQGDPGESRFFLSMEDDLMRRFGGDRVKGVMTWANVPEDEPIESRVITSTLSQAQIRMEGHNFDVRKKVLEYDDVVNKQRQIIYRQRYEWLELDSVARREKYLDILREMLADILDNHLDESDTIDYDGLYRQLLTVMPVPPTLNPVAMAEMTLEQIEHAVDESLLMAYQNKEAQLGHDAMQQAERQVMLIAIDNHWQRHLTDLDILREGIWSQSLAQRDPVVEYKRIAFEMWQVLQEGIREQAGQMIFRVNVQQRMPARRQLVAVRAGESVADATPQPVRKSAKHDIGRNDPCWCGSGKKYKQCHYKSDRPNEATN
ncbi:MAG: preprotein translocase subunit SecA [Phototrophicaceae bacterium]